MAPRTQGERLAALEQQVRDLIGDVADLRREIHGPGTPDEPPIRRRLHRLEKGSAEALLLERAMREQAQAAAAANVRSFSRREKLAGLGIAALVASTPYVLYFLQR